MLEKMKCFLDKDNHCFVLALPESGTTTVSAVFRSIIAGTDTSWKELAEFAGIKRSSTAFKVAYKRRPADTIDMLTEFLVIDQAKQQARFYDIDHRPSSAVVPHVGPTIANGEPASTTIYTKIPVKLTSRVRISDPLQRLLTLTLRPTNGYLLGVNDISLTKPNMTYQVSGAPSSLNKLLKSIHFVGLTAGDGTIVITVDDNAGDATSVSSTTVSFKIEQSQEVSIPEINMPGDQDGATIGDDFQIDPITVTDTDNKLLEVHITPFGCQVFGFKNNPFTVGTGDQKMQVIVGRPAIINEFISELYVRCAQEECYLGVELFCGTTRIRKYLKINATAPAATTPSAPAGNTGTSSSGTGTTGVNPTDVPTTHPSQSGPTYEAPVVQEPPVLPTEPEEEPAAQSVEDEMTEEELEAATAPEAVTVTETPAGKVTVYKASNK